MWLDALFKHQIQDGTGTLYTVRPTWQFTGTGVLSIADDPANVRSILTFTSTPASSLSIVRVNTTGTGGAQASPYTATVGQTVICDMSGGSVVIKLPSLILGAFVTIKHDPATTLSGGVTITINGNGTNIEQPPPNEGSFAATFVMNSSTFNGTSMTYFNGGSASGYLFN